MQKKLKKNVQRFVWVNTSDGKRIWDRLQNKYVSNEEQLRIEREERHKQTYLMDYYNDQVPYPLEPHQRAKSDDEWVYVFFNPLTKLYKIGKTIDLRRRLQTLSTAAGHEMLYAMAVRLLEGYDESNTLVESTLHKFFHHKRLKGERFQLSVRDLVQIRSLFWKIEGEQVIDNVKSVLSEHPKHPTEYYRWNLSKKKFT